MVQFFDVDSIQQRLVFEPALRLNCAARNNGEVGKAAPSVIWGGKFGSA